MRSIMTMIVLATAALGIQACSGTDGVEGDAAPDATPEPRAVEEIPEIAEAGPPDDGPGDAGVPDGSDGAPADLPEREIETEGGVGDPCAGPEDCVRVTGGEPQCMTAFMDLATMPNGYCTRTCEAPGDCGDGASCVKGFWGGFCVRDCGAPEDCRLEEGYQCARIPVLPDPATHCLPDF
jgi:hypothetical protein